MFRIAFLSAGLAASFVITGCASEPNSQRPVDEPLAHGAADWTREGLDVQARLPQLQQRTPADLGFEPGTTQWRTMDPPPPQDVLDSVRASTPGAAVSLLAAALSWSGPLGEDVWEQTLRLWRENGDRATAVVLLWGLQDDAVAGHDIRVHLVRRDGMWRAERLDERFHCRRRPDPGGICA